MFIRFLIYGGMIYLSYKVMKNWVLRNISLYTISGQAQNQIDDIMVQDPFCKVYFPKREGVPLNVKGETLLFCSTECRGKFLDSHSVK